MTTELTKAAQDVIAEYDKCRGDRPPAALFEALRAALTQRPAAQEEDERAAFELWARPNGYDLRRNDVLGHYSSIDTSRAWSGFRAGRASLPAPQHDEDDGDVTGQAGPLPETGWDEVPEGVFRKPSATAGMNLGERIKHVGGRENAAGYIEFGSVAAVRALVRQYLRDLPAPQQATPDDEATYCPTCGIEDGGTSCGLPDCGLVGDQATPEPHHPDDDDLLGIIAEIRDAAHELAPEVAELELLQAIGGPSEVPAYIKAVIGALKATPEPVGEPVGEAGTMPGTSGFTMACFHADKVPVGTKLFTRPAPGALDDIDLTGPGCALELAKRPAPGVPEVEPNEMESKWCWWLGDGERFHIADTESEAHGEAQCRIDDDCDPGQTHQYSVARVQHPLDSLGMDWLALHVAQSIAENVCCWCDDNTGAEEPSIMLSPDDSKDLGVMVATFLRQRVGVDWWTADQKTVTVHTYVSGSNDNHALAAAQAKGG